MNPRNQHPQSVGATEAAEAAAPRRPIDAEIAKLFCLLETVPEYHVPWIERNISALIATRDAALEATALEACEDVPELDLAELPLWAREIVQDHRADKAAERAAATRQAAAAAWRANEEAVTAQRRAALNAPQMGHLANAGGGFALRGPRRLTQVVSTPEQRQLGAIRQRRADDASGRVSNVHHVPAAPENSAPIPQCYCHPPRPRRDLTGAMP